MSDHEDLELELLPPLFPSSSVLFWTSERVEKLKALQARKLSGSAIAAEFGVTRNTVLGKLARLGLKCESVPPTRRGSRKPSLKRAVELKSGSKVAPTRRGGDAQRRGATAFNFGRQSARPPSHDQAERVASAALPITASPCALLDLTNERCRWPLGPSMDRAELFCGSPEADFAAGVVYCSAHSAIAFCAPRRR